MIHIDPEFNLQPLILPVKSHSRLDCYQLEKSLNFLFFNISYFSFYVPLLVSQYQICMDLNSELNVSKRCTHRLSYKWNLLFLISIQNYISHLFSSAPVGVRQFREYFSEISRLERELVHLKSLVNTYLVDSIYC